MSENLILRFLAIRRLLQLVNILFWFHPAVASDKKKLSPSQRHPPKPRLSTAWSMTSIWRAASPSLDSFNLDLEGEPATEETEVRVLYDGTNIYFGDSHDQSPNRIVVHRQQAGRRPHELGQLSNHFGHVSRSAKSIASSAPIPPESSTTVRSRTRASGQSGVTRQRTGLGAAELGRTGKSKPTEQKSGGAKSPSPSGACSRESQTWGSISIATSAAQEEDLWSPVSRVFNLYRLSLAR